MATSRAAGLSAVFAPASAVADAILYEGYLLYPYRRSSAKNKMRWQFGVLLPRGWAEAHGLSDAGIAGSAESWWQQTECLAAASGPDTLHVRLRFLQLQRRHVEQRAEDGAYRVVPRLTVGGREEFGFDEAVPREADIAASVDDLLRAGSVTSVSLPAGRDIEPLTQPGTGEAGRVVRSREAIAATVRLSARAWEPSAADAAGVGQRDRLLRVRVRVENADRSVHAGADREAALGRALLATHTLLAVPGGSFFSQIDPPDWARLAAGGCRNVHTFPVLADPSGSVVLSSPIILYDHPQVAPESPASLHDATEIDEILSLRTLTLTEQEKAEARATDPRAAAIIDRVGALPPEGFARLHGAIRSRKPAPPPKGGLWTRSTC
jgi:hypothetical protein